MAIINIDRGRDADRRYHRMKKELKENAILRKAITIVGDPKTEVRNLYNPPEPHEPPLGDRD